MEAWQNHFDEEGTAISGQITYAGCVVMLASNALCRFKDDLDRPDTQWKQCGRQYGGHSVGEILIFRQTASATPTNGLRRGQRRSAN